MFSSSPTVPPDDARAAQEALGRMLAEQPFGVLCTQAGAQPYGSLVAFAATADLRQIVFATPKESRKYRALCACRNVALVIDTRTCGAALMEIEAATATGIAELLAPGEAFDRWASLLLGKHPGLRQFVYDEASALVVVEVDGYAHVSRFQQTRQFTP